MGRRLALAAALLVVVVGAAWYLQRRADSEARAERSEARLLQFDDRKVTAFTLTEGDRVARFEKGPEGWRMTSPVSDATSGPAIVQALAASRRAPVLDVVTEPEALAAYGLDPPRLVLALEGVETPELAIGDSDPIGQGVFARVTGRPGVLLIGPPEANVLAILTANGLRDTSSTGLMRGDVEGIEVARGSNRTALSRESTGWWIVAPRRLPASDAAVERLLSAVDRLTIPVVNDAADPAEPQFGLGPGALEIVLATRSIRRVLSLGAVTPNGLRFASRDDRETLLVVDASPLDAAPLDVGALLDTRLTKINRYGVARMSWTTSAGSVAAVRKDDETWHVGEAAVPAPEILSFLVSALEAPVIGWQEGEPGTPLVASLVVDLDSSASERIDFHRDDVARVASLPGVTFRIRPPLPAWSK